MFSLEETRNWVCDFVKNDYPDQGVASAKLSNLIGGCNSLLSWLATGNPEEQAINETREWFGQDYGKEVIADINALCDYISEQPKREWVVATTYYVIWIATTITSRLALGIEEETVLQMVRDGKL